MAGYWGVLGVPLGPPPPFSPLDITGCTLWLDASDTATITHSGGDVSQWDDKSASGYHVTQATGSNQPSTGTRTQNGLNVIDFVTASNDRLLRTNAPINNSSNGAWTMFAVALLDATTSFKHIVDGDAGGGTRVGQFIRHNGTAAETIGFVGGTPKTDAAGVTLSTATAYLFRSVNGGTTNVEMFVDGSGNGSTALGGTQNYTATCPLAIGNSATGTGGAAMDGWIAEVIAYNTALSGGDITTVESYLTTKWAL